jgi:hypothetical protein
MIFFGTAPIFRSPFPKQGDIPSGSENRKRFSFADIGFGYRQAFLSLEQGLMSRPK